MTAPMWSFRCIPSIAMRGIGVGDSATRSLVLVDGIPINGGFFGNVFWNRVPKPVIDRVEVVRGASSSLFGSYAMGGVVNIVTAAPNKSEGGVEALYGQNNRFQGNFNYGYVVNENASLSFNGDYYDTQGFYRVPRSQIEPINQRLHGSSYNVQGQANLTFSNSVKGFLRAGYNRPETSSANSPTKHAIPRFQILPAASTSISTDSASSASMPSTLMSISISITLTS